MDRVREVRIEQIGVEEVEVGDGAMEGQASASQETVPRAEVSRTDQKGKFDCDQCKRKCRDSEALRRHMKIHKESQAVCPFCKEAFQSVYQVLHHKKQCFYKCNQCIKVFKRIAKFEKHIRMHTREDKRWA